MVSLAGRQGQLWAQLRTLGVQCCIPGISFPGWDHGGRHWQSSAGWSSLPASRLTCPIPCLSFPSVRVIV